MLSYRFFFQTYIQERIMDDHTQKSRKDGKLQYSMSDNVYLETNLENSALHIWQHYLLVGWL